MTHAAEIARQLANRVACMRDPAALREIACVVTRLESSSRDEARASHASDRHPPVDTAACTEAGPVGSMAGSYTPPARWMCNGCGGVSWPHQECDCDYPPVSEG